MGKQTYKLSNWHTDNGKSPIGVPYRNKWLYATIKGADLTDCTIDKVNVHFPKVRCTFDPAGELRMKYGGVTLKRKVGATGGTADEKTYNFTGAKDTMFKQGNGEVVFYAYHPYDEGYFAIDDANVTIEVEYTPKTSRLELPERTVEAGGALAFTVKAYDETYTHRATLTMGEKSAVVELAAGESSGSIDVPLDWIEIIPDKMVYTSGSLKLETLKNGTVLGSSTEKGLSLLVPFYAVEMSHSIEPMLTVDGVTYPELPGHMVQGKCGLRVVVPAVSGYYGSTVEATIRIGDKYITGQPPLMMESGLIVDRNIRVEVTGVDSRGMTVLSRPLMLLIEEYEPPHVELDAWRVGENGEKDDFGTKGAYKCAYNYYSLGGANTAKVTLSVAGVSENDPPETGELLPSEFVHLSPESAYDVTLVVEDFYETVTRTVRIPSAMFLLHGNALGNGAGIGHAAIKENALVVNPKWQVWMGDKEVLTRFEDLEKDVKDLQQGDIQAQITALQTQVEALKPKVLWEGEWSNGELTVAGISNYSVVQVDMGVGSALAFVGSGAVQGGGFNVSNALHRTVAFRATRNGDVCMLATAHYINHEDGSTHGNATAQTVTRIVGLVRST